MTRNEWRRKVDQYLSEHRPVSGGSAGGAMTAAQVAALNFQQRQAVLAGAVNMIQQINTQTIATPTSGNNVVNIVPRNVGMIKRFIIEVSGTFTNSDGAVDSAATIFGLANLFSNVQFSDLNNNLRINTSGLHLALLQQVKHKSTDPGSAPIGTKLDDAMIAGEFVASGTAPNFPVIVYPLPTHGNAATFRAVFVIPLAYSDDDLRGAIFANVLNATMNLQLTINPTPANTTTDATPGVWKGGVGALSNVTITTYQEYLDQIPTDGNGAPILPVLDLATVYELKSTTLTGITAANDFPIPYSNFRDFLSTVVVFNSTALTAGLKNGSDVNYFSLTSANFTNLFKIDPLLAAMRAREVIGSDLPLGTYYFSHRRKPISTGQYGNMQLNLNAASVSNVPYVNVYWEDFALQNVLTQAGSLAAS